MFCKELKEICTRIVNYEQKEMAPLTDKKKKEYYKEQKNATYVKKVLLQQKRKEDS